MASILWGLYAHPEFGNFSHRYTSFLESLHIDRVGSPFIVDLVIFATFQSWLVDDDLRRQGVTPEVELTFLRYAAKFVPFLVSWLTCHSVQHFLPKKRVESNCKERQ